MNYPPGPPEDKAPAAAPACPACGKTTVHYHAVDSTPLDKIPPVPAASSPAPERIHSCAAPENCEALIFSMEASLDAKDAEITRVRELQRYANERADKAEAELKGICGTLMDSGVTFDTEHLGTGVVALAARADALAALVEETIQDHECDNDCKRDPCMWCIDAKKALGKAGKKP